VKSTGNRGIESKAHLVLHLAGEKNTVAGKETGLAVLKGWKQARATRRRHLSPISDEKQLTDDIIYVATRYPRYGYRSITAVLNNKNGGV
jgi:hypothetical protein